MRKTAHEELQLLKYYRWGYYVLLLLLLLQGCRQSFRWRKRGWQRCIDDVITAHQLLRV